MAETKARPRRPPKRKLVEEHARSYFEALAGRDADAMASHWGSDAVADIVPLAVLRGPDEIKGFFGELFTAFPDLDTSVTRVVADDKHAVVEWRMSGSFTGGPFQGIDPTGKHVELRGLDILEIQDEEIRGSAAYYDGAEFARQVGMLPPRDSGPERAIRNTFNAVTRFRKALDDRTGQP
jgi:steroid delta-isomerase-like uncharacterized protein